MRIVNLCPECEATGKCWFKEKAEEIANKVSKRENLDSLFTDALQAHVDIMEARIVARKKTCPNLNDIDPNYPGKWLL